MVGGSEVSPLPCSYMGLQSVYSCSLAISLPEFQLQEEKYHGLVVLLLIVL